MALMAENDSSWRFISELKMLSGSDPPLSRPDTNLLMDTAPTWPPTIQDSSELAPSLLAPWYWYSHSPDAKRPGMFVIWLKSTQRPPME